MLEREQFDVLHFHEPFVPFLSLFLLRESTSVNIATFHAYAGFSPSYEFGSRALRRPRHAAARPDRGQRRRPPLHRPLLPGRLQGHPQRRRRRPASPTPCRSRAGRTARPTSCSSAATSRARACSTCSRRTGSCAGPGSRQRLLVVGSGPQEREARRYVATRGLQGVEFLGRVTDDDKAQLFRTADVYVSPATGGESFGIVLLEAMAAGTPIVCSDIHGYKGVVRRGREGLLVPPRDPRELAMAIDRLLRDPGLREQMGAAGQARAEEFSWPRVTAKVEDYYGFVIRRLAAQRRPAAGLPGRGPSGAAAGAGEAVGAVPGRTAESPTGRPALPGAALALDSASASRQTEAE